MVVPLFPNSAHIYAWGLSPSQHPPYSRTVLSPLRRQRLRPRHSSMESSGHQGVEPGLIKAFIGTQATVPTFISNCLRPLHSHCFICPSEAPTPGHSQRQETGLEFPRSKVLSPQNTPRTDMTNTQSKPPCSQEHYHE